VVLPEAWVPSIASTAQSRIIGGPEQGGEYRVGGPAERAAQARGQHLVQVQARLAGVGAAPGEYSDVFLALLRANET